MNCTRCGHCRQFGDSYCISVRENTVTVTELAELPQLLAAMGVAGWEAYARSIEA
ncbi:MAG: hypothetical protein AB7Q81_21165 [Gammaproteobacteria bacterium]